MWSKIGCICFTSLLFRFWNVPSKNCLIRCKMELVTFLWFLSIMCFHKSPQIAWLRRCIFTYIAFVWLFPNMCYEIFFKLPARINVRSHWWHFFTSLHCVCSNELKKNCPDEKMWNYTGCIRLALLKSEYSNESSNC